MSSAAERGRKNLPRSLFRAEFCSASNAARSYSSRQRHGHRALFTVRQASAEMIILAGSIGLLDRRPGGLMLRKSSSARGAPPEPDKTADGSRSWAAMRARLRQGREPIFAAPAGEPPPAAKPAPATSPVGHKAPASERPAKPGVQASAPAQARAGAKQNSAVTARETTVAQEQRPPAAAPTSGSSRQATSEAPPPANGADQKGGNGADHGAQASAPAVKPATGFNAGFEARPDATPGARIGRVISVAGPLVWGVIEAEVASTVRDRRGGSPARRGRRAPSA